MRLTSIAQLPSLWKSPSHGPFNGARNFTLNSCNFYDIEINAVEDRLAKLRQHALARACFDSNTEDPLPHCHPNTRRYIIDKAQGWVRSPHRTHNMWWISGAAGVGKSAIMGSIAQNGSENKCLGASVFLSRSGGRDDPKRIITTIALQLATEILAYRSYLNELLTQDPQLLENETRELFRKLISEPFGHQKLSGEAGPWLVLIDGLDECDRDEGARGEVCKILLMVNEFMERFPTAPFLWIVASRPEPWLKTTFNKPIVKRHCWNQEIAIEMPKSSRHMEIYLESEFQKIREEFPLHTPIGKPWPSASQTHELVQAFSDLFVFASTVMHFVRDQSVGNPVKQLEVVLSTIAKCGVSGQERDPLSGLHKFYLDILKGIPNAAYVQVARRILGTCDLLPRNTIHATSFLLMCNFLSIEQGDAYGALNWLHSVLGIPSPQEAVTREVKFLHSSFPEFLRNPSTPNKFRIERPEAGEDIVRCSLRVLKQANSSRISSTPQVSNIDLSWGLESEKTREALLRTAYDGFRMLMLEERKFMKSFPLAKRVELLEDVDFSKLDCYLHPDIKTSVQVTRSHHQNLFEWLLAGLKTYPEFQGSPIVKSMPTSHIDYHNIRSDRAAIHLKFTEEGKIVVRPKVYSGVKEIRGMYNGYNLDALKSILPLYEGSNVYLFGKDPKKSCILFEHVPSPQANSGGKPIIKEIFFIPYQCR